MKLDEMVKKISGETGIKEEEILDRIEQKRKELGGLITLEGAAHIVANELGINLFEKLSDIIELKIENIIPGMRNVDVIGRVLRIFPSKSFKRTDGKEDKMCSMIIGDETGNIRVVVWGRNVNLIESGEIVEGDILKIRGGYTKENINGEPEIHINNRTRIIVNPADIDKEKFPTPLENKKKIEELEEGMVNVDVVCRVVRIYELREFEREDGSKGKVLNLLVADETGKARVVLWDEDVNIAERIREGDTIKVKKGYVKFRFGEPEINVGRYGKIILNPKETVTSIKIDEKTKRKEIKDIKIGEKVEIRGAIVEIYDNLRIFDKDDGKGVVINAVIDDGTAHIRSAFYDKVAEVLLNIPLEKILNMDVKEEIEKRKSEILGKEVIVTAIVRYNNFSNEKELVVQDINLNPDPKEEIKLLLDKIRGEVKWT